MKTWLDKDSVFSHTGIIFEKGGGEMDQNSDQQAPPQLVIPAEVRTFLEGLVNDAGMTTLDEGMREEMVKELYARLDNYMTSAIVDNLPAEYLDAFIKMNEEKKPREEVEEFLKEHMPNATEVFAKAFADFRALYLGNVTVARNAPESTKAN